MRRHVVWLVAESYDRSESERSNVSDQMVRLGAVVRSETLCPIEARCRLRARFPSRGCPHGLIEAIGFRGIASVPPGCPQRNAAAALKIPEDGERQVAGCSLSAAKRRGLIEAEV